MSVDNPVKAPPEWSSQVAQYLEAQTGLTFKESQFTELARNFSKASSHFGFQAESECLQWLLSGEKTKEVLAELASFFTIGETYFFRERNSFEPMARKILGEIIERKVQMGNRRIRIWSAACSTGEEAYSIAILLNELLPLRSDWDIRILASDLNPISLQRARAGVYRKWSFRGTPDWVTEKYFEVRGEEFSIDPSIKSQVTFDLLNLADESYPSDSVRAKSFDLIFCRNVLIYFSNEGATNVADRLKTCLADDGWLVVSPPELGFVESSDLTRHLLGNSIFHQNRVDHSKPIFSKRAEGRPVLLKTQDARLSRSKLPARPAPKPARVTLAVNLDERDKNRVSEDNCAQAAEDLFRSGNLEKAKELLISDQARLHSSSRMAALMARILLRLAQLEEALRYVQIATRLEKMNPEFLFIEGTIYLELQDINNAKKVFDRVLYLDPQHCGALYFLGNMAKQLGRIEAANRLFRDLQKSLSNLPKDTLIFEEDRVSAGRLLERLEQFFINEGEISA